MATARSCKLELLSRSCLPLHSSQVALYTYVLPDFYHLICDDHCLYQLLQDRQTDGIENRASSAEVKRFSIYLDEKLLGLPQATTQS